MSGRRGGPPLLVLAGLLASCHHDLNMGGWDPPPVVWKTDPCASDEGALGVGVICTTGSSISGLSPEWSSDMGTSVVAQCIASSPITPEKAFFGCAKKALLNALTQVSMDTSTASCNQDWALTGGCDCTSKGTELSSTYPDTNSSRDPGAWNCMCKEGANSTKVLCLPDSGKPFSPKRHSSSPSTAGAQSVLCSTTEFLVSGGCFSTTGSLHVSAPYYDTAPSPSGWTCSGDGAGTLYAYVVCGSL
jgi:hypothetical protein